MPFSVYGDGIKKILYILNKLFDASDSILMIDEIETGLHKKYYEPLFPVIFALAKKLNVQLFIATHSIEAIDAILEYGKYEDSKQLAAFIRDNYQFFCGYDVVKVYYDNGQVEVTRILSSVFNALLENVEFRKVMPADYRLFQVADLICTLKLTELKMENHQLSKSEVFFFNDERTLKKNYLKPLSKKEL